MSTLVSETGYFASETGDDFVAESGDFVSGNKIACFGNRCGHWTGLNKETVMPYVIY